MTITTRAYEYLSPKKIFSSSKNQVSKRKNRKMSEPQSQDQQQLEAGTTTTTTSAAAANTSTTTTTTSNNNRNEDDVVDDDDDKLSNYLFCFASYHAIFLPVSITMILSALAVVYINTEESRKAGAAAFASTYEVFDLNDDDGNTNGSQKFLKSIGNTLIMVSVICVMTFIVVILYKFKCMKIFYGYMIIVTTLLLGYFSTNMVLLAIHKYEFLNRIDWFTLIFVMYNFAIVGTISIFYSKGIPNFIKQGYLIASSIILAWQFSFFGDWTAWTLLVALALWDLFAVLTPCGPLKQLAELMSKPGAQPIPGLLYEAALPSGVEKPNKNNNNKKKKENQEDEEEKKEEEETKSNDVVTTTDTMNQMTSSATTYTENSRLGVSSSSSSRRHRSSASNNNNNNNNNQQQQQRRGKIPLALAIVYRLQVIDEDGLLRPKKKTKSSKLLFKRKKENQQQKNNNNNNGQEEEKEEEEQEVYTGEEIRERKSQFTAKQLRSEITVIYPSRGGNIEKQDNNDDDGWVVYSRSGQVLREFIINDQGQVFLKGQESSSSSSSAAKKKKQDNSIKLGLGDFIFYSVLVSKAALSGFTSFSICMIVILFGLLGTLVLLSVYGKALPALPISILLGVAFFFCTQEIIEPWLLSMIRTPIYV